MPMFWRPRAKEGVLKKKRWIVWTAVVALGFTLGAGTALSIHFYVDHTLKNKLAEIAHRFGATVIVDGVSFGYNGQISIRKLALSWPREVGLELTLNRLTTRIHIGALLMNMQRFDPVVIESCDVFAHNIPNNIDSFVKDMKLRVAALQEFRSVDNPSSPDGGRLSTTSLEINIRSGSVTALRSDQPADKIVDSLVFSIARHESGVWVGDGTVGVSRRPSTLRLVGQTGPEALVEIRSSSPWALFDGAVSFTGVRAEKSGRISVFDVLFDYAVAGMGRGNGAAAEVIAQIEFSADKKPSVSHITVSGGHFAFVSEYSVDEILNQLRRQSGHSGQHSASPVLAPLSPDSIGQLPVDLAPEFVASVKDSHVLLTDPNRLSATINVHEGYGTRNPKGLSVDGHTAVHVDGFPEFSGHFGLKWDTTEQLLTQISADIDNVSISSLFRRLKLPAWSAIAGSGRLQVKWSRPPSSRAFFPSHRDGGWQVVVSARDWVILHPKISPLPVVVDGWQATLTGSVPPAGTKGMVQFVFRHVGGAQALVDVVVDRQYSPPRLDVLLHVPEQDCSTLVAAIPAGLLPTIGSKLVVTGRFEGDLNLFEFDFAYFPRLRLESKGTLTSCKIESLGALHDERVEMLSGKFKIEVDEGDGPIGVFVGPRTPGYMAFADIPELVRSGAILSEDGEFFLHEGISLKLIEGALRLDLAKGRYVYGGSTITQQLVKNLFVGRSKSLARKLEELFIVRKLEQTLRKERILELYLNCIEYGVHLYGIRNASYHYFGKEPRDLTGVEVAFLMHLKTTPKEAWYLAKQGALPDRWRNAVRTRMRKMVERGRITQEEFDASAPYDPIAMKNGALISQ